ncbi:interleukin-5 receptor subunit alpha-like [Rhinatrema bivittatum]|uniref:interleukin-5 receptor subunit alpha-like n=1 Tax=Rhinatrema bivittatum TaxID=194408 RepID=UPI00112612CE|nr:interleukin-5 receptor subunit alpha-like [Rhinatrema bivittatum]
MVFTAGTLSLIWFLMAFPKDYVLSQVKKLGDSRLPSWSLTNLKMAVPKPGYVRLTWDCNVTEEIQKGTKYRIHVKEYLGSDWQESEKEDKYFEKKMELHKGLSFKVTTTIKYVHLTSSEIHYIPEGLNGTSAENVSCVAYNVFSMNCSWTAGREAPEDTQYFLTLRQKGKEEKCQHYKKDSFGRQIACRFRHLKIDFRGQTYAQINGSSKISQIQFFDKWFQIFANERLVPPVNITVITSSQGVTVQWEKPTTSYAINDDCFKYEIYINKKSYTENGKTSFLIPGLNMEKRHTLKMRANPDYCSKNPEWGEWSTPVEFGNTASPSKIDRFYIPILMVVLILIAMLSVLLCIRCKVIQKLFPPIPQPKNKFSDINHYDMDEQSYWSTQEQPSLKAETEEIIVTSIQEMA